MSLHEFKKIVFDKLSEVLKPLGFRKRGRSFELLVNDLVQSIDIQSSTASSKDEFKFTINLYIRSIPLSEIEDSWEKQADIIHFAKRIGFLMKTGEDKWWSISNIEEANNISEEVTKAVVMNVIPEFRIYNSTQDLIATWNKGDSPGLTDITRLEYLLLWNNRKI